MANYPNGCHICEIEVDTETGEAEIVRYSVVDDVGTVLNPMLLHGQIHGGIAQGAGQALMEDIHFDGAGQLVTGSFMDYAMPHAHDFCAMAVESNAVPTKTNPIGAKGAGEAGCVGALPAVVNALVDALRNSASSTSKCRRRRSASGGRCRTPTMRAAPAFPPLVGRTGGCRSSWTIRPLPTLPQQKASRPSSTGDGGGKKARAPRQSLHRRAADDAHRMIAVGGERVA